MDNPEVALSPTAGAGGNYRPVENPHGGPSEVQGTDLGEVRHPLPPADNFYCILSRVGSRVVYYWGTVRL